MASSITFTGLGSGLDTASIVSQLMDIERAPQDALRTKVATEQTKLGALQGLNSALASLQTSAESFADGSTWTQVDVTSSNPAVKVTASSSANAASLALSVTHVATAASNTYLTAAKLTDSVVSPSVPLTVTLSDGTTTTVDPGDGTLDGLIAAFNGLKDAKGTPLLSATAISAGGGSYRLVVNQLATGAGSLSIADGSGEILGGATQTAGSDAAITAGGIPVTQRSNTFAGLMPGVDVTLTAGAEGASTVSVADDGASRASALAAFVSQVNSVIDQVNDATAYGVITAGAAPKGPGVLAGDMTVRQVADHLLNTVFPPSSGTLAAMGLDLDRTGHLTFDKSKFQTAYQADPQGVQAAFIGSGGFASRVSGIAEMQSDPTTGALTQSVKSENDQIKRYNDEISDWDDRLTAKQASLTQQYTALNTMLSRLQSQSSWLTTQLDSLTASKND